MENSQELLTKLEQHSKQQLLLTKITCILCAAIFICLLVMTVLIVGTASHLSTLAEDAEFVIDNLEAVSWELANADIGTMVDNIGTLAADSQTIVAEAMKKLEAIDIETLNEAIEDLAAIVEPLVRVSSFFD